MNLRKDHYRLLCVIYFTQGALLCCAASLVLRYARRACGRQRPRRSDALQYCLACSECRSVGRARWGPEPACSAYASSNHYTTGEVPRCTRASALSLYMQCGRCARRKCQTRALLRESRAQGSKSRARADCCSLLQLAGTCLLIRASERPHHETGRLTPSLSIESLVIMKPN